MDVFDLPLQQTLPLSCRYLLSHDPHAVLCGPTNMFTRQGVHYRPIGEQTETQGRCSWLVLVPPPDHNGERA